MILLVVATSIEARPIIQKWKLKKVQKTPFQIWDSPYIRMIISGIGKVHSAIATAHLLTQSQEMIRALVNFGIAGHLSEDIGSCLLAHKIVDESSQKSFYPNFCFSWDEKTDVCITFDTPYTQYEKTGCYDMEGSGFFQSGRAFIGYERIHLLKVISDNPKHPLHLISKEKVLSLLENAMPVLERLISTLNDLPTLDLEESILDLTPFIHKWHFTTTQQEQLKTVCTRLTYLDKTPQIEDVSFCNHSKQVLIYLHEKANSLS